MFSYTYDELANDEGGGNEGCWKVLGCGELGNDGVRGNEGCDKLLGCGWVEETMG